MAGEETKHAPLGIGYQYTPSQYQPQHVDVPTGAGALWAGVGATALSAAGKFADVLRESPLNPEVKARIQYNVDQFQAAQDHIAWLKQQGRAGQMAMATGPGGLETVPAGRLDIDPMVRMALRSAPTTPTPPSTTDGSDSTSTPETITEQPDEGYSASWATVGAAPPAPSGTQPKPKTQTHKDPGDVFTDKSASAYTGPSPSNVDAAVKEALVRNRFASSEQGIPADYQPPQPQQGGNIWSPQRPAPLAPPAPGQPPPQQPVAQSQTPAAATQADQVAMQKWQEQNAHPVMSSQDALSWMKNQTTLAQDATYLPMGGPGGSPAYAFHMKGGGQNIVPISQMIQKGAGPLVAAQNTSAVLSKTDQAQGGDQGYSQSTAVTGAAPPPQPQQLTPGPPAAPAGPYPMIASDQGGLQGGPPAAPSAYNAAAYQMPQGPTITQAGNVNPALMAGGTDEQALAASRAAALPPIPQVDPTDFNANVKGYSMEQLSKMAKDPTLGDYSGFQWKQDRKYGTKYAVMRSLTSPFKELRWNAGLDQWQDTLKENGGLMEQVQQARANTPMDKMISDTDIADMSEDDLKQTLDEAVRLHATGGDESSNTSLHIRGSINQSKSLARQIDILEQAQKAGIPASEYSTLAQDQSKGAAERNAIMPSGPPKNLVDLLRQGVGTWHNWEADGGEPRPLVDHLTSEAKYFGEQMAQTPGLEYSTGEKPENKTFTMFVGRIPIQIPVGRDTSSLQEVNRIFSNAKNPQEVIDGLKTIKSRIDDDIVDSTDRATRMGYRTPPQFKKAVASIQNKQNIDDNTPKYTVSKPATSAAGSTPAPGATPGPTPALQFDNVDAATNFTKNAKSGTRFDVKDSKGIIHHMQVN